MPHRLDDIEREDNPTSCTFEYRLPEEILNREVSFHADFGIPGPLVHVIERYPGVYESLLEESLARAPMSTTVHMVNRQLNAELSADERCRWTGIMEGIARNTELPWEICDQAEEFLNYQRSKR